MQTERDVVTVAYGIDINSKTSSTIVMVDCGKIFLSGQGKECLCDVCSRSLARGDCSPVHED
jgi:hypothetical protein